jgi:predicted RNase H-like nuclease (RuvC/YqgF family)
LKKVVHVVKERIKINDDFFNIINSKFEELGLNKKVLAEEQYKNKVSSIKGNNKAISTEKQFLRLKIDRLKKEISQYENNISFFGKNKDTEPLRKQVEEKIANANTEIETLKQKLQILNKG